MKAPRLYCLLAALLWCANTSTSAASNTAPTFPESGYLNFKLTIVNEKLESQLIERLQLSGPRTILSDFIPGLSFEQGPQSGPAVFSNPHYPDIHASLYAFPKERFATKITPDVLNAYLARKALDSEEARGFEIIEEAQQNLGPAKFRFLGGKAFTLTYDYDRMDRFKVQKRFRCTENWRLHQGIFYVFVVEAPVPGFAKHYQQVARSVSNMHFID